MAECWALIPAAGLGRRMGSEIPKQYLTLGDRTVLNHTLDVLLQESRLRGVVIAVSKDDEFAAALPWSNGQRPVLRADGGAERCHSVLNGLQRLAEEGADHDWVLVHDAARPCLRQTDLARLIDTLNDHPVGGLLGVPVRDTMKRSDKDGSVTGTVDREGLWHALTPQMFRLGELRAALEGAIAAGVTITDEASAMEWAGKQPLLVEGHSDNLKITRPEDLALAQLYLQQQERL